MDFKLFDVKELQDYLKERGVTCYFYKKQHLIQLCELADELCLEVLDGKDMGVMLKEDYESRRTVDDRGIKRILEPIETCSEWTTNLSKIPDIESCDVMLYLLKYCSWSDSRLRKYKSDDGYKLYLSNHIDSVEFCPLLNSSNCYIKSTCIPQTRQNEAPYSVWVLISSNGEVISGGCTCVAGNGTCKHCVALLFSVMGFCDRHKDRHTEACTDVECSWDRPKKTTEPAETDLINIRMQNAFTPLVEPTPSSFTPNVEIEPFLLKNVEKDLYMLFKHTNALVLQILDPLSDDESISSDEYVLPTIEDAFNQYNTLTIQKSIGDHLKSVFTNDIIREIENLTIGQANNPAWFSHRRGRITASIFPSVMHFRFNNNCDNYILKKVMGSCEPAKSASLQFGRDHESIARHQYSEYVKKLHKSLKVEKSGLCIDINNPHMGASPDGIVTCKCCGKGLLEIKCSDIYQNVTPSEACNDNHYHIYCDENGRVKISSPWYLQIQGQMGVCDLPWCDFVFYTKKGISVDRIQYDPDIYQQIVEKCTLFF